MSTTPESRKEKSCTACGTSRAALIKHILKGGVACCPEHALPCRVDHDLIREVGAVLAAERDLIRAEMVDLQRERDEARTKLAAMCEAIKAARGLLHHVSDWHRSRRQDAAAERWDAALAKLHPFLPTE